MSRAGFGPTFPGTERPQTHALDLAATGIDMKHEVLDVQRVPHE